MLNGVEDALDIRVRTFGVGDYSVDFMIGELREKMGSYRGEFLWVPPVEDDVEAS